MNRLTRVIAPLAVTAIVACGGQPTQQSSQEQAAPAQQTETPAQASTPPAGAPPAAGTQPAQAPAPHPAQQAHAQPAAASKPRMITVPAGEMLNLAVDSPIDSGTAHVGDSFSGRVIEAVVVDNKVAIPTGSKVRGSITQVKAAKKGAGSAELAVTVDTLVLPDGYKTQIVGNFHEMSESQKKRNAAIIGGSAAGGAVLGKVIGKDTKGAVIGSVLAGGIGTAVVLSQEGKQVVIPADTPFMIKLEEAVTLPQAASS